MPRTLFLIAGAALLCATGVAQVTFNDYPIPTANSQATSITTGSDGNLWFTEIGGNQIGRVTTTGIITEYPIPTPYSHPAGITAGPDGNVWFTEYSMNKIGRITPAGVITEFSFRGGAFGIVAGPDGNLWFTDTLGKIGRISPSGLITEFPVPDANSSPYDIQVGPDGNLWFTDYGANKIGKITLAGVITEFSLPAGDFSPSGITAGPDGNLWSRAANAFERITPAGSITHIPFASLNVAGPIVTGPDGNLWFTETGGVNIANITLAGRITEISVPANDSPTIGITFGPDGNIWFTEGFGNNIGKLNTGRIVLPANVTMAPGQSVPFSVALTAPALPGGVVISLASSDPSIVNVVPANSFVPEGSTTPRSVPQLNGINFGSATITASAIGLPTVSQKVRVAASLIFSPANITILGTARQLVSLTLSAPAPAGGLTINLSSDHPAVAAVPATATFLPGVLIVNVPFSGVGAGSATITASALPNIAATTASVTVVLSAASPSYLRAIGGTPQSAAVNMAFGAPFVVLVNDVSGNPVPGATVTFTPPAIGASGSFAGAVNTATTNAAGLATSAKFTANGTIGAYNVIASISGLAATDYFSLNNTPLFIEYPIPAAAYGLTAGPDGNLWFTEYTPYNQNSSVGRITPAGLITNFSVPRAGLLARIAAGSDGNLWFTDELENQIGRITTTGVVTLFVLPTLSASPFGIAAGPDGNLWFTEFNVNQIGRITPAGAITEFPLPSGNEGPAEIVLGPDRNLWFTASLGNQIGRITTTGVVADFRLPVPGSTPRGIAVGPDGNLWFTEYTTNVIGRITPTGTITQFALPPGVGGLFRITAGPDGNLWFTEYYAGEIGRITPSGAITEFYLPTSYSQPDAIVVGPDGNIWFTDVLEWQIGKFSTGSGIILPANITVAPGQSVPFPVTLSSPANSGGLILSLASSDSSTLTVTPRSIFVPEGSTTTRGILRLDGINFGSATITASALGLPTVSQQVRVTATLSFFPANVTIKGTGRVSLILSAPAPTSGLAVALSSDNPGVAIVPAIATFPAGATGIGIPVTGVGSGSATITASAPPNIAATSASITVQ